MKKIYTLLIILFSISFASGQIYLEEDFSNELMPPEGWSIDAMETRWAVKNTNFAGGNVPEARLRITDADTISRLISPVIDLSGSSGVMLSFRQYLYDYHGEGYSLGVAIRSGSNDWEIIYQVSPSGDIAPENRFVEIPASYQGISDLQFCFFMDGNWLNFIYWYIDNVKLLTPSSLDMQMWSLDIPNYVLTNEAFDIKGVVLNKGTTVINSFEVSYIVNDENSITKSYSGVELHSGDEFGFAFDDPHTFTEDGLNNIAVYVSKVNETDDEVNNNDTLNKSVGALPYKLDRRFLAEEATGTWCGWCTRGFCFMDYMADNYPDEWIGVAIHAYDTMEVQAYASEISNIIPNFLGYPNAAINRTVNSDPMDFEEAFLEIQGQLTPLSLEITDYTWNEETREISFSMQTKALVNIYDQLRFLAIIVEDSVWGRGDEWSQKNYYSGGGQGEMCGYENMPDVIPDVDMHYDHVARAVLDSPFGTQGSLPETLQENQIYSYNFTYSIPEIWDFNKVHLIGAVLNTITGEVLNADIVGSNALGTPEIEITDQISIFPNPTKGLVNITKAENSDILIFNSQGKLITSINNFRNSTLNLSSYPKGIYLLKITTDERVVVKRLILN